ncbi:MAG TPA: polysaccharide deacetylase family protein [Ignavibacteriaceae bacterium]
MIRQILFTIFLIAQISHAQGYGTLRFTNYANDRQSAFSLTFDDGLLTHIENVGPILNQYGIKGTFYVLPPYLTETLPGIWRYGTWPGFQSLAAEGHEISSHTMNHYDLTSLLWGSINDEGTLLYELCQSQLFIQQKIPAEKCISLNYPYTIHNSVVDSAARLFYENGRTLGQVPNDSSLSEEDWFGLKAKVVEFSEPRNSVADDLDELYSFLEWTQNSINNHKWGMIIIHDVVPFDQLQDLLDQGIYEPVTNEWLTSLCDFLWARSSDKEVWVETVGNITRYIKERDDAQYQIISSSNQLIQINVSDNLENAIFNYPLSAYVKVPNNWEYVRTEQNGIVDTLTSIVTDSGNVVLAKVIPDNGILKLSPVTATNVENEITEIKDFELYQNYPNPFNPSTKISWQSPIAGWQTLKVYDVLGNEVVTLLNEYRPAGTYEAEFNLANESIRASGVYFYKLQVGDPSTGSGRGFVQTKKMILLR